MRLVENWTARRARHHPTHLLGDVVETVLKQRKGDWIHAVCRASLPIDKTIAKTIARTGVGALSVGAMHRFSHHRSPQQLLWPCVRAELAQRSPADH